MPELPELRAHAERLDAALRGRTLASVEVLSFTVAKTFDPAVDAPVGRALEAVSTRGKHVLLGFGDLTYAVHLMQSGRLRLDGPTGRRPRGGLLRWRFDDGTTVLMTEAGTERRAGVWVLAGDPARQAPLDTLGPDADGVEAADLARRLRDVAGRLHGALRDQRVIAGIGRRLANDVCHRAGCSPFATTGKLTGAQLERLHEALRAVLAESLEEERTRDDLGHAADRTTSVHGRTGQPCPVCGDVVREVAYRHYTVHYCATCQTDGKVLADNTYSRLGVQRDPPPAE